MKNWKETSDIYTHMGKNPSAVFALATIVRIEGSTYRRPGAKLLIEESGHMRGNVSGGCLEQDVCVAGLDVIRSGEPRLLHYDTSMEEETVWGLGLGCNGKVDLFVQAIRGDAPVAGEIRERLRLYEPFRIRTILRGPDAGLQEVGEVDDPCVPFVLEGEKVCCEGLTPPPKLVICGAGDDAIPLVEMAAQAGLRVIVIDHRKGYLSSLRFPQAEQLLLLRPEEWNPADWPAISSTLVVVKTHALRHDADWLLKWSTTDAPYIGLLGPKDRRTELMKQVDPVARNRVYGPVGLDIGGEGAELVAVSVVAEALAVWHKRGGGHLRNRNKSIHDMS